jgi:hypothetical protein
MGNPHHSLIPVSIPSIKLKEESGRGTREMPVDIVVDVDTVRVVHRGPARVSRVPHVCKQACKDTLQTLGDGDRLQRR